MAETRVVRIRMGVASAYLLLGECAVLVDTGYRLAAALLFRALRRAQVAPGDLALILLTHGHADHYGNAAALRAWSRAPLAVGAADASYLLRGKNVPFPPVSRLGRIAHPLMSPPALSRSAPVQANLLLEDALDLAPYGVAGHTLPTPGHTPGSLSVALDDGRVLVGDLLLGPRPGGHLPRGPMFATEPERLLASVRAVMALQPTLLLPAHGGPIRPAGVREKYPEL